MIYLYVLVAIALSDQAATQTIGYYATVGECIVERNKVESTVDKTYVKLDCVPIKAVDEK